MKSEPARESDERKGLEEAHRHSIQFLDSIAETPPKPSCHYEDCYAAFSEPLPDGPSAIPDAITELARKGEPGLMGMQAPTFFRWVIGGCHPAGIAADWLTSAWSQNTGNPLATPSAAAVETVVAEWLLELLDLPRESSIGFVTGATLANFVCLAASRHQVLAEAEWDVESNGLYGAPLIQIFMGAEAHTSINCALRYLGIGSETARIIPTDDQGRMDARFLAEALQESAEGPKIVISQAGQINTGAFDPFDEIACLKERFPFWLHVDGAFGLWARASDKHSSLAKGAERADSWATDGHKWLQTPYDCGYAIVKNEEAHRKAMAIGASYLPEADAGVRDPAQYVPELSRRARGFASWAIIKTLGRQGIAELIERHCRLARLFADLLASETGIEIINTVVLNQVIVRFGEPSLSDETKDELTEKTIEAIVADEVCYLGGSIWKGRQVMRISIVSWRTQESDIRRSSESIIRCWRSIQKGV